MPTSEWMHEVAAVQIDDMCLETCPCTHKVLITLANGKQQSTFMLWPDIEALCKYLGETVPPQH